MPPDRSPVREDAHHVSPALGLLGEAVLRVVRPDLPRWGHGEGSEGEDIRAHGGEQFGGLEEAFVEHANHGAVFRVYLLGRQLLIDRPHDGRHPGLARRGILKSRLDMKWVQQRCHEAPAKTVAVASFSLRWASEVTISTPRTPSPAPGPLSRHRPRLSPLSRPRLSPRRLSTPPRNRPHRDGQRQDAGAAIARKDGRGYGYFGGCPAVSVPPSGGGGLPQRAFAGAIGTPAPYAAAKRPLWPSSRNVNCGVDQPLAMKARNVARCIGQRAYGRRGDLLLGL